jgi:hypothetical protein
MAIKVMITGRSGTDAGFPVGVQLYVIQQTRKADIFGERKLFYDFSRENPQFFASNDRFS